MTPCAASTLLAGPLDEGAPLREAARTRLSVHYETGRADVPVLCVGLPAAVRLPNLLVVPALPSGSVTTSSFRVTRWWRPARPRVRPAPGHEDVMHSAVALDPAALVGRGAGLTPTGDDVLAGALVAAHAVRHPLLDTWRAATRDVLRERRTTVVSWGLLHHALDGWAAPELAAYVDAVTAGRPEPARSRLLALGHSSGRALADGADLVLDTAAVFEEGAA